MANVTPLAGVWIEMPEVERETGADQGHSPRGSVD